MSCSCQSTCDTLIRDGAEIGECQVMLGQDGIELSDSHSSFDLCMLGQRANDCSSVESHLDDHGLLVDLQQTIEAIQVHHMSLRASDVIWRMSSSHYSQMFSFRNGSL